MLFASKCPLPALVGWCRALKHSIGAGLDPLKIFRQQAKSGPRPLRATAEDIALQLGKGESLEDALERHRDRFPPLFVELVAVGERTGRLEDTFRELEHYYETTLQVQRNFRSQMMYPLIQFVAGVLIISMLILVLSMIGSKLAPFGLSGPGAALAFLVTGLGGLAGAVLAVRYLGNNVKARAVLEGMCLVVPGWGPAFRCFAVHRFAVALRMTTEAGLRAEQVLRYCFRATANAAFTRGEERAVAVVKQGGEMCEALEASGAPFPSDFREAILVAEESGQMSEVAERLSENYREEAARQLKQAAAFTSYALYGATCLLLIVAIFGIASSIQGVYNDAMKGL